MSASSINVDGASAVSIAHYLNTHVNCDVPDKLAVDPQNDKINVLELVEEFTDLLPSDDELDDILR